MTRISLILLSRDALHSVFPVATNTDTVTGHMPADPTARCDFIFAEVCIVRKIEVCHAGAVFHNFDLLGRASVFPIIRARHGLVGSPRYPRHLRASTELALLVISRC